MNTVVQTYKCAAGLSECGTYRYWLRRTWDDEKPVACFVMLNPSTADGEKDDPTIRRCVAFAKAWGYGALTVLNLFAYRATDPKELLKAIDPIGPDNESVLEVGTKDRRVVVAWGKVGKFRGRAKRFIEKFKDRDLHHIGLTKDGSPRHPLYVRGDVMPRRFI